MKKFFSFVAILATALVIFVGCKQSGNNAPTTKLGLTDGTREILAPVAVSGIPKDKKLSELIRDEAIIKKVTTALNINDDGTYSTAGGTYSVTSNLYSNATTLMNYDAVLEAGKTYYLLCISR